MANIKSPSQTKKEAWLTFNQRITNLNARVIVGANLGEKHVSEALQKQLLQSCGCGKQLDINENNEMIRRFTCKKRFCRACTRRMAFERDMALYPSVNSIINANKRDPKNNATLWFVTLTLPTCEAGELGNRLSHLQSEWRYSYNAMKKRDNKAYVNGIRKLEVNAIRKKNVKRAKGHTDFMYHAHLHIVIQGLGNAQFLRRKWLERNPEASRFSQDIRRFNSQDGSLRELLKYLAKPVAKGEGLVPSKPHCKALAFIYDKLRGRRTIFTYGKIKKAKRYKFDVVNGQVVIRHGDAYDLAFDESSKYMQDKLVRYINNEKAKASRDIRSSMFKFYESVYVENETGELLCSEQDIIDSVREADERAKKRKNKKSESTKMDAYKAERKHFERTHGITIGKGKKTIESIEDKVKRLSNKIKEEEEEYIYYKRNKKKDPTAEP